MRKLLALILACATLAAGCGARQDSEAAARARDDRWGIALSAADVSPTGLTLVITQSGGEPTGSLEYGSPYSLEVLSDGEWEAVPYITGDGVAWTAIGYAVEMGDSTEIETNWETLYGSLAAGMYRLCKEFSDFRGAGDYDTALYYAEFEIE